jgi:hypothetical protein
MKYIFIVLIVSLFGFAIENDYPYLTKPVPKPQKDELPLTPNIKERTFNEKMDEYNRCIRQGKQKDECDDLLSPRYDLYFELKP